MNNSFHFLRPWWLLAVIPVVAIVLGLLWRRRSTSNWRRLIAPHLLPHLLVTSPGSHTRRPVICCAIIWMLCVLALSGPTWKHEPNPFSDDEAAVVIVLKVTTSMRTPDLAPDRLARSVQKIHDLLKLRPGAKTGLIAYSGSVHVVAPLTNDPVIITTFADALDPAIMPIAGDAGVDAIAQAMKMLADARQAGSVLWITDGISLSTVAPDKRNMRGVTILACASAGPERDALHAQAADRDLHAIDITPDDGDVAMIASHVELAPVADDAAGVRWHDSGYALVPWIAGLGLLLFRRGVLGSVTQHQEAA